MSSRDLDKKYFESNEVLYGNTFEVGVDYSKIIIPFIKICKSNKPIDIYSGNEKIQFLERDLEFRMILQHEFSNFQRV